MMYLILGILKNICLVPVIGGSVYVLLCLLAVFRFRKDPSYSTQHSFSDWPPVTILKPVRGLEKNQRESLRSACLQDYPEFQVVYSVQDLNDPVIPLLKEIQQEFGDMKVSVAIENLQIGTNGKINNLLGALPYARNDILVISDSDVYLKPDYLKVIVAPLANSDIGGVCTLYKATCADRWFEKMELLTFNADFIPSVIFAHVSRTSKFCIGASIALRRSTLKEIGGLESLADYLVEDYEMGRRIWSLGKKIEVIPYFIDIVVDYKKFPQWWNHQIYWDQNLRAARPGGFFASIVTRSVPFAFLFTLLSPGDFWGPTVLVATLGLRLVTTATIMWELRDYEGLRSLPFLLLRDVAGLASWFLSFTKRSVVWRGSKFILTRDGRLISSESRQQDSSVIT
jgi:ceramide glucosyltransferase